MATEFVLNEFRSIDEVDQAPEQKGLYAWYARLSLGKAVYEEARAGGAEEARSQTMTALRKHSAKHRQQPLKVDALANFSISWRGALNSYTDGFDGDKSPSQSAEDAPSFLGETVGVATSRVGLLSTLSQAFPIFLSPLYIGMTIEQTLRQRLERHKSRFLRHWEQSQRDHEYAERITDPRDFAERAVKVGLAPRDLSFFTLHLENGCNLSNHEQNNLIKSAEWLLNKWASPLLGRK
jgi:hypothetical protein